MARAFRALLLVASLLAGAVHALPVEKGEPGPAALTEWESLPEPKVQVLFAVVSAPTHVGARNAIRETWGKDVVERGHVLRFFVGLLPDNSSITDDQLAQEGDDIIRLDDFVESYHNLTAKTLDIFQHAWLNGYDGVFKADDDSYVRVPLLLQFLSEQGDLAHLYAGAVITHQRVGTNPNGRWYASDQFDEPTYPPYCNGPGVFLGQSGLSYISTNRFTLPQIRVDDAAIGVWLRDQNVNRVNVRTSNYEYHPNEHSVWINPLNPDEMRRFHSGQSFVLQACEDARTECLCFGSPKFSEAQVSDCWQAAGDASYQDAIPRTL